MTTTGAPASEFVRAAVALLAGERPDLVAELRAKAAALGIGGRVWLCDSDGTVRRGVFHHGIDYACTGSAHVGGYRVTCGNPVHNLPVAAFDSSPGAVGLGLVPPEGPNPAETGAE